MEEPTGWLAVVRDAFSAIGILAFAISGALAAAPASWARVISGNQERWRCLGAARRDASRRRMVVPRWRRLSSAAPGPPVGVDPMVEPTPGTAVVVLVVGGGWVPGGPM